MLIEMKTRTLHYFRDQEGWYQGEYKWWHNNGQIGIQCYYLDNKKHGEYTQWYSNGNMTCLKLYYHGKKHGENKYWYGHGNIQEHYIFKHSTAHGEYKRWDSRGELEHHGFYVDGKEVSFDEIPYPTTSEERMLFMLKYDIPLLPVE